MWRAQGGQVQGEAEEANWNPMDWDRPAEELTWERLLGLDGSLLFLEHVFWVILLNTLFILVIFNYYFAIDFRYLQYLQKVREHSFKTYLEFKVM